MTMYLLCVSESGASISRVELECIHGILTLHASPYVARSILPVILLMGVRVALLTVTTMCNFERGGATKLIIGSS